MVFEHNLWSNGRATASAYGKSGVKFINTPFSGIFKVEFTRKLQFLIFLRLHNSHLDGGISVTTNLRVWVVCVVVLVPCQPDVVSVRP